MKEFKMPLKTDYAIAQSVFSHCGKDLIGQWLSQISYHLKDDGALVATFQMDIKDFDGDGWVYPGCVNYKPDTMAKMAVEYGFDFSILDWGHPRQTWALFSKKKYDKSLIEGDPISWNRCLAKTLNA